MVYLIIYIILFLLPLQLNIITNEADVLWYCNPTMVNVIYIDFNWAFQLDITNEADVL